MRTTGAFLLGFLVFACNGSERTTPVAERTTPVAEEPSPAALNSSVPEAPVSSSESTRTAIAPTSVAAPSPAVASEAPASFENGQKNAIAGLIGVGCETKSLDGWLEIVCHKKNGTGGHPTRALIRDPLAAAGAPEASAAPGGAVTQGDEVLPTERGELRLVVPFHEGTKRSVSLEWTDTRYTLDLEGAKATFTWAGIALPHRRACQALLDEARARIEAAQKLDGPDRIAQSEAKRLPKFGVCQPAGLGSWALALTSFTGRGEGTARTLSFVIDAVRIDLEGKRLSAPFGTFEVAPGGLEIGPLQAYDFDDDGNDELIVPYEINAVAAGAKPAVPSPIWTFSAAGIAAYEKAPAVAGGLGIEHLDSDMRPDLGTYGPFVAWLGSDCGLKTCPPRINGPRFFFHSSADGGFAHDDAAARSALERACPKKSGPIFGANGPNASQIAKNLVCARARKTPVEALRSELAARRADLCGTAETCPLAATLETWLEAPLPVELEK